MCKIEIIKYGLLYCDLLYTLRIGVFDGFLSYKKTIVIMESTTEKRNISMLYWDEAKKGMMAGFIFSLFIYYSHSFLVTRMRILLLKKLLTIWGTLKER